MTEERRKAAWISKTVIVKGEVNSTDDLVIDGQVHGAIELGEHNLTIGHGALVVADLAAKTVTISGTVKGSVMGSERVELKSSAVVDGDVVAPKFVMEEGATLAGRVEAGKK